jgi:pimeloyl-ACP methyl ester carboxylesterase
MWIRIDKPEVGIAIPFCPLVFWSITLRGAMQGALAVFLIMLGVAQLASVVWGLRAVSLVGPNRWLGSAVGLGLIVAGAAILPQSIYVLLWTPLLVVPVLLALFLAGSYIFPVPHPNLLFSAVDPAHRSCRFVRISDGDSEMPGYLLRPASAAQKSPVRGAAVCIVPGAGDTKTSFKWRLIRVLLDQGLTVLTIDPPGHGDNHRRVLSYPDCLSAIPAAIKFLRDQPGITRVGLIGISLGGALAIRALAEEAKVGRYQVQALVVFATPDRLNYHRALFYREAWRTLYRSPVMSLFKETTLKQIRESWTTGGYRSQHRTSELFDLLEPAKSISTLDGIPILLVYSQRDPVAPADQALMMRRAASHASFLQEKKASHVMLTLNPQINGRVAAWLSDQLRLSGAGQ